MKCHHEGIRDRVKATVFVKVIDFHSKGHLKVEIDREKKITHKFDIAEKSLYVLVLKFADDSRHRAANLQVLLQRYFLYEKFIARKTLVCTSHIFTFFKISNYAIGISHWYQEVTVYFWNRLLNNVNWLKIFFPLILCKFSNNFEAIETLLNTGRKIPLDNIFRFGNFFYQIAKFPQK